jgi:transcription elongation factor Elf1
MNNTAGIRHLHTCPSCQEETWHALTAAAGERYALTCLACGLTTLLTQEQYLEQQNWEADLDQALKLWEENWQSSPEPPQSDE